MSQSKSVPTELPAVHVLHDNAEWIPPFRAAFEAEGVPLVEWDLTQGAIDLDAAPPAGVFWSRVSASSHTRHDRYTKEYARAVLVWLEAHGATVLNGRQVVEWEVSKIHQVAQLRAAGFNAPRTVAVFGDADPAPHAAELGFPLIVKHNQGGKGLGVRRVDGPADLLVAGDEPVDGITLLQEYVPSALPFITRAEFVRGRFVYAVQVDTSAGSFELCPAEACAVPTAGFAASVCTIGPDGEPAAFAQRTEITAEHPLVVQLEAFLAQHGIDVAGVEFIETADGRTVVYDINTNTNYNPVVEAAVETPAARVVARALGALLDEATRELRSA